MPALHLRQGTAGSYPFASTPISRFRWTTAKWFARDPLPHFPLLKILRGDYIPRNAIDQRCEIDHRVEASEKHTWIAVANQCMNLPPSTTRGLSGDRTMW